MKISKHATLAGAILAGSTMLSAHAAFAQISGDVVKIGVMADQSGPYADNGGPGSVEAAKMAVEDFGGEVDGKKIDDACSPMGTQWVLDTYSLAKGVIKSQLAAGNDTFYFITVDYTFGKTWQADATKFIEDGGGKVLGSVLHPLNNNDFSSYLLQAQASGAKVIVLANSGADFANAVKQAQEFGIQAGGQQVVALGLQINQVHGIGLEAVKGMSLVTPGYWDLNDETRAFADKFKKRFRDRIPNETMAGTYSAVTHYLKAVKESGTDDGEKVVAKMHEMPVNDFQMKDVKIRADGQVMRPMYAVTVKAPADVKQPYDYYVVGATIPAEDVWRPEAESTCPLLKK